jgi:hypothetical protein
MRRQTCYASHNFVECKEYDKMDISISGHGYPQTPNAPYDSAFTGHQTNHGIGHYAGRGVH